MRVTKVFFVVLCFSLSVLALILFSLFSFRPPMKPPSGPAPVSVMRLRAQDITQYEELSGRTVPHQEAEIRPQVGGIILARLFEEGSQVQEGQQLYQIDDAPYLVLHQTAQADLERALAYVVPLRAKHKRYQSLLKIKAISAQENDDLLAQLKQAEAQVHVAMAALEDAKIKLAYTKVYAPISGRIGKSYVTKGALVTANQGQSLAKVTQLDPICVDMNQSARDFMRMKPSFDQASSFPVQLYLDQGVRYGYEGKMQFSDVTVEQSTGSVQMRAIFPNPKEDLLPGLLVRARVVLRQSKRILIPQSAAIRGEDAKLRVWVLNEGNIVLPRQIEVEKAHDQHWVVGKGVNETDVIVLEGFQKIKPGSQVDPTFIEINQKKSQKDAYVKVLH